jgi:heat-inducible transcriptional repressor
MTSSEILASKAELSPEEEQVSQYLAKMIAAEDRLEYGKLYLEGLHLMLSQPEFANNPKTLNIVEMLEGEDWLRNISCQELSKGRVKVVIGKENPEPALQDLSLIISPYGIPDEASGIIGVLGPKRMDYARAISSLNCLSVLLSNSIASQW